MALPDRRILHHEVPSWVPDGALMYITICCSPREKNQLATPQMAEAVIQSIHHYMQLKKWWVEIALLMPDHLHAFISFSPDYGMKPVVKAWKRYMARIHGISWQDGFFDHRLRSDKIANEKWHYIINNPVVEGLVSDPKDWPYVYRIGDSPKDRKLG